MPPTRRDPALDALRMLAIALMACSHSARLVPSAQRPFWGEPTLLLEPLTQALFLALVGASLLHSLEGARARGLSGPRWLGGRLRRVAWLAGLSTLFFIVELGPTWPHLLLSTGILTLIAASMALYAPLLLLPRPGLWVGAATLGLWALALTLDDQGRWVLALNGGNGPLLPSAVYAGLGLCAALVLRRWPRGGAVVLGVVALVGAGVVLALAPSFVGALDSDWSRSDHTLHLMGRSHGLGNTWDLLRGVPLERRTATFFNPRAHIVPLVWGLVSALYALAALARPLLARAPRWLLAMGRHSLGVYVLHLGLVALPIAALGTMHPFHRGWQGSGWLLAMLAACWIYALLRDRTAAPRAPHAS
ncbi:MAG: heparan-alpha-glucosaminide N-acetyltransferase domain-containing protein [Pseudomonadota bacterium]